MVIDHLLEGDWEISKLVFLDEIRGNKAFCTFFNQIFSTLRIRETCRLYVKDVIVDALATYAWSAFAEGNALSVAIYFTFIPRLLYVTMLYVWGAAY